VPVDPSELPWSPTREDRLRARDRARVHRARSARKPVWLLLLLAGPGVLVMLGENDGPSMLSYATTGATYGIGFFIPFIVLTFWMAYIVQEMTVRVGIATRRGHAELIFERFGKLWGGFALVDLLGGNLLTLVTEFVAIRAGCAYFGIPPPVAVGAAVLLVMSALATRRYMTWERSVMALALANLLFIPAALYARPDVAAIGHALASWSPFPGGSRTELLTLVLANVGATVTPWMIFFQQSAVVDKGLTKADLLQGRIDTALGATLAAIVAVAAVVAAAPLFAHHVDVSSFSDGADFATALRPYLGSHGAALIALGMIEAGLVAAMTISTSSAYAVGEVLRVEHSLNLDFSQAGRFYFAALGSTVVAAAVVLIPHAPLLAITLTVNVVATLLMAPALVLLLLLANDRTVMGSLRNTVRQNLFGGIVAITIAVIGAVYGLSLALAQYGARP
jgi:Mn2+/Fe2+ NRAMP family transporter